MEQVGDHKELVIFSKKWLSSWKIIKVIVFKNCYFKWLSMLNILGKVIYRNEK